MATLSDHITRDAHARAYSEVSLALGRYKRRIWEDAKANIAKAVSESNGDPIDGDEIGKLAVSKAIRAYVPEGTPRPAIEAGVSAGDPED